MINFLKKLSRTYPRLKQLRFMAQGISTFLPNIPFLPRHRTQFIDERVRVVTDYKNTARACYTSWLCFLVATKPNLTLPVEIIAEIGPGDCLGVGLAALLSGSNTYYAIDKFSRSRNIDNMIIFDELVELFKKRAPIPEFPKCYPKLDSYEFPKQLEAIIATSLMEKRIDAIRETVRRIQSGESDVQNDNIHIAYPTKKPEREIDFLFSLATMEHIEDTFEAYKRDYEYLKPGGIFAHAIGFNAHGTAWRWNGHWTYSPIVWKIIGGRTKYLINRWPYSWHIRCLHKLGFKIAIQDKYREKNYLSRKDLSKQFSHIPDDDLTVYGAFISGNK